MKVVILIPKNSCRKSVTWLVCTILVLSLIPWAVTGISVEPIIFVEPKNATNMIGSSHSITALLAYENLTVITGVPLNFTIISGPNAGMTQHILTNETGYAVFSYNGSLEGVDYVFVSYQNLTFAQFVTNSSGKIWVTDPVLEVTPKNATNPVGSYHTVTATLVYKNGTYVQNGLVQFSIVSGPNAGIYEEGLTNSAGSVSFIYQGLTEGSDFIELNYTHADVNTLITNSTGKLWVKSPIIEVTPKNATNLVNTNHTVTATLLYPNGTFIQGGLVTFSVVSGPHTGLSQQGSTNSLGSVSFTYTGSAEGLDLIQLNYTDTSVGSVITNTSGKLWVKTPVLEVTPKNATNPVNTNHTVTATLLYPNGTFIQGGLVTFSVVSGPHTGLSAQGTTSSLGSVSFTYTGTAEGTDLIQLNYTDTSVGSVITNTSGKLWVKSPILEVTPKSATNPLGTNHTVTATLVYPNGTVIQGGLVTCSVVSGPHIGLSAQGLTNESGSVSFTYKGTAEGTDLIQLNYTHAAVGVVISNTSGKLWVKNQTGPRIIAVIPGAGREPRKIIFHVPTYYDPTIIGSGFQQNATVFLRMEGQEDIPGLNVTVVSSERITCIFDYTGKKPGDWDLWVVNPDGSYAVLYKGFRILSRSPAGIVIRTIPAGAYLTLDGADIGPAEAWVYGLSEGNHTLTASKQGYVTWEGNFTVDYPVVKLITITLTPLKKTAGSVAVLTSPKGMVVTLDGHQYGTSPIVVGGITPGNHTIGLHLNGYTGYDGNVTVIAGSTSYVTQVFLPTNLKPTFKLFPF